MGADSPALRLVRGEGPSATASASFCRHSEDSPASLLLCKHLVTPEG